MGFLSRMLDDVIHPFGLGHSQPAPQQGRPAPAVTPAPGNNGGLTVSTAPNNQQIEVAPPPQRQLAPAIHFAPPAAQPDLRVSAAPAPILLGTDGRPVAASPSVQAPPQPPPSLADHLRNALTDVNHAHQAVGHFVNQAVVKPITNIVAGDIVEPTRAEIGSFTHNAAAEAAANARAEADQANSLPQMLVKPFFEMGKGLAYTPKAIYRELQNKPIDDIQQRVFGTTDSGTIAKEIGGNTGASMLTVAIPGVSKLVDSAAAPVLASIEDPVTARLAAAGVRAATQAPVGAAYNTSSTIASDPNASAKDLEHAAASGALLFAAGGAAPDLIAAAREGTPQLVTYAKDHAAELKQNEIGAVGKNVNKPVPPEPQQPSPIDLNKNLTNQIENARGAAGKPVPKAPPEIQQVIDAARQAIKSGDIAGAGNLADSLPSKYSAPLKAELGSAPMPSNFLTNELDNSRGVAGQPKKTGVVDKQLQQIQATKKGIIDTATNDVMQAQSGATNVLDKIRQAGGISKSDHESLPSTLKNKNGLAMDEMAANLGYGSDQALMDAIDAHQKPLTPTQAREQVTGQLESGQHPYSTDYAKASAAEKARMDELALYPKGTRAQVKVNDKAPAAMSEAELQSLAGTPEAKVQPAGNKITPPAKDAIRNPDAERAVLDKLQKGAGSDAILSQYMKDTGTTLQQAVRDVNRVAKEANIDTGLGKNPREGSVQLPQVQEGDWKQATLNARHVQYKEQEIGSQALESYKSLSPHDQLLLKQIEAKTVTDVAKQAENPAAFKAAEQDLRNYFDTRHAYDKALGIDVGYRTNYIRHFFDKAEEDLGNITGDEQVRGGGANKNPGYTKQRTNETLVKSVQDALERDISGSSFNHAKLAYENGLNDAFPGKISNGEIPRSSNEGKYQQIDHPFGQDLSAPKAIAHDINTRVWHPNDSVALDRYDAVNRGLKYVKLSGGLFHAFTESGNFLGQQLTSGKIFTDPVATGRLAKVFFSDKAMSHEVARMADTGVLDKAHLAGLTIRSDQILADANIRGLDKADPSAVKGAGEKAAKYTGVQAMHDATFQREIPYAKLKIFEQKTAGLDPMKPEDLAIMRKQAESINNLFGGINREIHGIKPGTFKWLQRGLLATDFTEGKFATLAKALTDKGAAGTTARQAVAGKVLLFGLIATAGAAAAGGYDGKSKGQIAKDAAGNLIDPQFEMGGYKVGLPKTHVSEVVDALKPTSKTGKAWNASGLVSYAQNRSAALPSEAISLLSNKNYYGQPLYGTNTKKNGGGKISAPEAGLNIAQTVLPIPFGQATNTVSGKQAPAAAAANIVGFKAKPNPDNTVTFQGVNTTMNDKQTEAYQTTLKNNTAKITSQLTSSPDFKALSPNDQAAALSDLKSNVTAATQRDFASKNGLGQFAPDFKGKDTKASTKEQDILSGSINPNSYFPSNNAGHNSDSAAVAAFKKSDSKITTIGDQTYYKTGSGQVKNKDTFTYQNDIKTADLSFTMDRAKASGSYTAWTDAANQRLDQLQTMLNHYDPQTEPDKIDAIKKEAADLTDQMQKYNSYGGQFTKPPKGRKGASSNGISYKFFNPTSYEKSLRSLLDAARVA